MKEDDIDRFKGCQEAIKQGYANAQDMCNLGVMYAQGCGVSKDEGKAVEWL